jgi:hypothetical protein
MWGWLLFFVIIALIVYKVDRFYAWVKNSPLGRLMGWAMKPMELIMKPLSWIPAPMSNRAHVTFNQMPARDDIGLEGPIDPMHKWVSPSYSRIYSNPRGYLF